MQDSRQLLFVALLFHVFRTMTLLRVYKNFPIALYRKNTLIELSLSTLARYCFKMSLSLNFTLAFIVGYMIHTAVDIENLSPRCGNITGELCRQSCPLLKVLSSLVLIRS